MTLPPQVHPALTRLRRRLELCQAPLVRLWGWPHSGRRLLLQNLTRFHPDSWFELPAELGLEAAVREVPSHTHLWWAQECVQESDSANPEAEAPTDVSEDILGKAIDALDPGQRLLVLGRPPSQNVPLPETWIRPEEWLLTAGELAAVAEDPFGQTPVDTWMDLTAGWWGPFVWLLQHSASPGEPGTTDEAMAQWLNEAVLGDLPPLQRELLDACRLTGCHDPALWRRVALPHPELLQAVEAAVQRFGWLGGPWPTLWDRVPWTLSREHVSLGPVDAAPRRTYLHRRLAAAASALGRSALAVHHLDQAGASKQLERWRGWRGEETEPGTARSQSPAAPPQQALALPTDALGIQMTAPRRVIEVDLLGSPRVVDTSQVEAPRPVRWTLKRALMTLAYLLLAPQRRATREELIDAVWDGVDERGIQKNFHPTLSTLRRVLGKSGDPSGGSGRTSLILFRQGIYSLSEGAEWRCDVDRFSDLVRRGQELQETGKASWAAAVESWQQAWRLYRGPLLGEEEIPWVVTRRRQLHETYRRLLRQLADVLAGLQRDEDALDVYRALLLEEPFEEAVHLAVMELYGRRGRRDLVRRQFVRLQEMLRSELGVEPQPATQQRFDQLMH